MNVSFCLRRQEKLLKSSAADCTNALFVCVCLVVRHLKTLSEPASETAVMVTATRLTVTRTPTKVPAAICQQRKPSSWRPRASNHRLWNKVSPRWCNLTVWWMNDASQTKHLDQMTSSSFPCAAVICIALLTCMNAPDLNWLLCSLHFSRLLPVCLCVPHLRCERAHILYTPSVYQSRQAHYVFISPTTSASPFSPPSLRTHRWNFDNGTWKMP